MSFSRARRRLERLGERVRGDADPVVPRLEALERERTVSGARSRADDVAVGVEERERDAWKPDLVLLDLVRIAAAGLEVSPDDAGDAALKGLG
jgi:hypothetical protein